MSSETRMFLGARVTRAEDLDENEKKNILCDLDSRLKYRLDILDFFRASKKLLLEKKKGGKDCFCYTNQFYRALLEEVLVFFLCEENCLLWRFFLYKF